MMHPRSRSLWAVVVGLLAATVGAARADGPPLLHDLDAYFLLASRFARIQDLSVLGACNVGVNCATPVNSSTCGKLILAAAQFADGSQVAGDRVFCTKPGTVLWQLFRNGGTCGDASIAIVPPLPFMPPILPATCDASCTPDVAALEAQCGFPVPFPACDPAKPVTVRAGGDCEGAADAAPGNLRCDLAPGAYGSVRVLSDARLSLDAGMYTVCGLRLGRRADVPSSGSTVAIPAGYGLRVGVDARLGSACGAVEVLLQGDGSARFSRRAQVAARLCAPERRLHLGAQTVLVGRFVADTAVAGRGVRGTCCAAGGLADVTDR
jgi:hypothetical protein